MKKILRHILLISTLLFLSVSPVFAYNVLDKPCESGGSSSFCKNVQQQASEDRIVGPNGIITKITKVVIFITGAASIIVIIGGGIKYVLANGDSNAVASAKNTILYALVGLAVALLAQTIVAFVLTRL